MDNYPSPYMQYGLLLCCRTLPVISVQGEKIPLKLKAYLEQSWQSIIHHMGMLCPMAHMVSLCWVSGVECRVSSVECRE